MTVDDKKTSDLLADIAKGGKARERALVELDSLLGRKLEGYFVRHKVPADDAEEMVWEVWLKLCQGQFRQETRAIVWIWIIARNVLISHHRASQAQANFADDDWEDLVAHIPAVQAPAWLSLCIEQALHRFTQDFPERSEMLRMLIEEWSAREIGAYLNCNEGAARDRLYRTRQKIEPYLEECRSAYAA